MFPSKPERDVRSPARGPFGDLHETIGEKVRPAVRNQPQRNVYRRLVGRFRRVHQAARDVQSLASGQRELSFHRPWVMQFGVGEDSGIPSTPPLTNLEIFRTYVEGYLQAHPLTHKDMILMVRQLAPSPHGAPIEIYCFSNDTGWSNYEAFQS